MKYLSIFLLTFVIIVASGCAGGASDSGMNLEVKQGQKIDLAEDQFPYEVTNSSMNEVTLKTDSLEVVMAPGDERLESLGVAPSNVKHYVLVRSLPDTAAYFIYKEEWQRVASDYLDRRTKQQQKKAIEEVVRR